MSELEEALSVVTCAITPSAIRFSGPAWAKPVVIAAVEARSHQPPMATPAPSYYGWCWSCAAPQPDYLGGSCELCQMAIALAWRKGRPFRCGPVPPGRSIGRTPSNIAPPRRTARTRKSQQMALKVGT